MSSKGDCWDNAAMESFFSTFFDVEDVIANDSPLQEPPVGLAECSREYPPH